MNHIPKGRKFWRLATVQLSLLGGVINAAAGSWMVFQGAVSPLLFAVVNMILSIAVVIARRVPQPSLASPSAPNDSK